MSDPQQEPINWLQMWSQFRRNVQADKLAALCRAWGCTPEATKWLGVGWNGAKNAWIFPERDAEGEIVGLTCRAAERDGTPKPGQRAKYAIPGSTRGLTYAPDPEWGVIPKYIDHPIPIPEGASDVLASLSIGMYAIGRPSATGTADSNAWLQKLVKGRDIALCMEYDKGAGMVSVLDHAKRLFKHCTSIRFLEPPEGVKDIREWLMMDSAVDEIDFQLKRKPFEASSLTLIAGDVLTSSAPMDVAKSFIVENYNQAGKTTLRRWNGRWMYWDGNGYYPSEEESVRNRAYQYLDGKQILAPPKDPNSGAEWKEEPFQPSRHKVGNIVDAARAVESVAMPDKTAMPCWLETPGSLPRVDNLIVFQNGILDVAAYAKSGKAKWLPKTPLLFTQNYCPYIYRPEALPQAKPFVDWLYSVVNGCNDTVQLLRQWGGYCMTNNNSFEKFMFIYGRPSAGKGTFLDVLKKVIGPRNVYSMKLESLGDGFSLYSAMGHTNVFMPDTQAKDFEKTSNALEIIKTITGRGSIDVAGKGVQARSYDLNCRFTIAANEIPNFHDSAGALRRRLLIAPFPNSYEGQMDRELKDRLVAPEIIQGAAAWFVQGYIDLLADGEFPMPAAAKQIQRDFEESNNPVSAFFSDNVVLEPLGRIPKGTIYDSYERWCKENGYRPWKQSRFKLAFVQMNPGIATSRARTGEFPGERPHIYTGVRLKGPLDA